MKVKTNFQLLNQLFAIRESVTNLDEQNETIDKIEKAIEILVTSEPATTEPKSKFEELLVDTFQGYKPLTATMDELNEDLYQRYLKMIDWYICEAGGRNV